MPAPVSIPACFPSYASDAILAFQFSSWYPHFSRLTIKSTVIRPLSPSFRQYLSSDGVFVPDGADDVPVESALSDDEDTDEEEAEEPTASRFAFPELDAQIRAAVDEYDAVFPKLNFSSPRDAAWILPASSPLKCTSPADVYLLLKSSDFIQHDIHPELVFDGCDPPLTSISPSVPYELELVLRKWYPVDRARELRCFVRHEILIGISQRDPNYYDFWNEPDTQQKVLTAVSTFFDANIKGKREQTQGDYIFDFLLTRDLSRGHIVDFNPYHPRTDPLLFSYPELHALLLQDPRPALPVLRVVDSPSHPAATRNAPAHQHNMVPLEALAMSSGRTVESFADVLSDEIRKSMGKDDDEDSAEEADGDADGAIGIAS